MVNPLDQSSNVSSDATIRRDCIVQRNNTGVIMDRATFDRYYRAFRVDATARHGRKSGLALMYARNGGFLAQYRPDERRACVVYTLQCAAIQRRFAHDYPEDRADHMSRAFRERLEARRIRFLPGNDLP